MPISISDILYRIYRAKILFALNKDLNEELNWLNDVSLKYLKNYQIWYVDHHPASTNARKP
jgi:protein farnesyltransferase/geranylgeranyltransferase type-1 subunit alpha